MLIRYVTVISQVRQVHASFARTDGNFVIILLFSICVTIYIYYYIPFHDNKKRAKISEDDEKQVGKGEGVQAPQGAVLIAPVKHPHLSQQSLQSDLKLFLKNYFSYIEPYSAYSCFKHV